MVTIATGSQIPAFAAQSKRMVRIDLNHEGRASYQEGGVPETAGTRSERALHEIRVELKASPPVEPNQLDAISLEPSRYQIEFENERVRIVRLRFEAREKGIMVHHPPRVLATISDVTVKLKFSDGRTDQRGAPAGVAAWLDAETLQTENAADSPLVVVLVEPK
jgi:hypothetical protein